MKKIILFISLATLIFSAPSYTGLTGGIDFPSAYILIDRNYTISGIIGSVDGDLQGDFVVESNLIPKIEAGIKLSTGKEEFNSSFLQSNFKFQLVGETESNPAIAIGFTEFDEYESQADKDKELLVDSSDAYAFLVMSKRISLTSSSMIGSMGVTFSRTNEESDVDGFITLDTPLSSLIRMTTEFYSYDDNDDLKLSGNLGFEFLTADNFRTQVFWRERNNSIGVSINYIGILNNK